MKNREMAVFFMSILLLGSIVIGSGCADKANISANETGNKTGGSEVVKTGDTIRVDYTGKLEDGTVFDTSREDVAKQAGIYNANRPYKPLTFVAGAGQMIKGFDNAVIGMKVGEEKTITIPPEEAYGEYNESNTLAIPLEELNMSKTPEVGDTIGDIYGQQFKIIAANSTHVTIDLNSELAGKTLVFDIKLVSIE